MISDHSFDSIIEIFQRNVALFPDKLYLVSRYDRQGRRTAQLHRYTWAEADGIAWDLACALYSLGFRQFDRLAIFSPNRPRFLFATLAALLVRGVMVPIYPTSKAEDLRWILEDSEAKICCCGSRELLERVLEVREGLDTLEQIIVLSPLEEEYDDARIIDFNELLKIGRRNQDKRAALEGIVKTLENEDMVNLFYTSGTTGRPKGVILTNRTTISQTVIISEMGFRHDDIWMAHLPFCHAYGFAADFLGCSYLAGTMTIIDSLDTGEVRWGLSTFQPTVMYSVPRLWEKIYLQINTLLGERSRLVQRYFKWAVRAGSEAYLRRQQQQKLPLGLRLRLLFSKPLLTLVKKKAGLNRLRLCGTGGAAISRDLIIFFGALGIALYQGYGLTETGPVINVNTPRHNKIGTVGRPFPGVEEKIEEDGEILVRGPQVMKGYWKNPAANREAFTPDGFFRTGDIGFIDDEGYLTITDRKKELLKTSGGKYVAPQPIENAFNIDPYIEQVVVVGENRKHVAALIVPAFEALEKWAGERGIGFRDRTALVQDRRVEGLIRESVDRVNRDLAGFEQIKKYRIVDQPFSEEGGELTPSLKIKRRVIDQKYRKLINAMYPAETPDLAGR